MPPATPPPDRTASDWAARAARAMPGGVNSPVRAFRAVGGAPIYAARGAGARVVTAAGRELVDFCGSWGPLILGHAHPAVVAAVERAARDGTSFGITTPAEIEFAELIRACAPHLERLRLVNSGTEAMMTALRLARGATGRALVLKFAGAYHGHADPFLGGAGSGLLTGGIASSAGVPAGVVADVLVAPYNDAAAVDEVVAARGAELAAIVVEPVAGNMGLAPPDEGFLPALRAAADRSGALLVFDEVITGFRLGPTTYGELAGVTPDLTCLGKIIGGGLPIGAVGGPADLMRYLAPEGKVYQAGTLSGNPVAVAAGRATLEALLADPPYDRLAALGERLRAGAAGALGPERHLAVLGGMFTCFCGPGPVRDLAGAKRADAAAYARLFHALLARGIYLPPAQFEVAFISAAHGEAEIDALVAALNDALGG